MDDDFSIAFCIKCMAFGYEVFPKFRIIENFTIKENSYGLSLIMNGLVSTVKINNAQAGVGKACRCLNICAGSVRTPVMKKLGHF